MTISEQIETIINSLTDNNIPPQIITITKAYNKPICDITTQNGEYKNIRCSGLAIPNSKGLLIYENGDQNRPYIILFQDAETTIQALGLGLFTINQEGELIVELPNGITNPFNINTNGELTVTIPEGANNNYQINENGDITYTREEIQ